MSTNKGFEGFKKQLQALKEKGADIDPNAIINEIITPPEKKEQEEFEKFDRKAFELMRKQIDKLLDDFENHYGPKGNGLSVAIHVQKENCADRYADHYPFVPDKLSLVHIVDIGKKGVHEPFDPEKEKQWVEEHNKKILAAQKQVEERGKKRKKK